MGTEVLHPQDLLAGRLPVHPPSFNRRRNSTGKGNPTNLIVNRRSSYNTSRKKTSPRRDKRRNIATAESGGTKKATHGCASASRRKNDGDLVMGKVTLLRRGESLGSIESKISGRESNPRSPNRNPVEDMEILPKQIRVSPPPPSFPVVYAGSAFSSSPSPHSLPMPSFFNKKEKIADVEIELSDNPATLDLRRLLRLE